MCRSIKTLRGQDEPPTDEEVHAAALQFVRKISGYRVPSRANEHVFETAVGEVGSASSRRGGKRQSSRLSLSTESALARG